MTRGDLAVRNATYQLFAELGRAPTRGEVGDATGQGSDAVADAWRRLHDAHALVLDAHGSLLMVNPFSAVETAHRVAADGRTWFANCGWDAFGIGVVLGADSEIHTTCADCGEPIDLVVRDGRPIDASEVFHVLVPARDWWSDIGFT